uniref:Uncharacterized protein n=1 Tax=Craspedostauros australis TaxID=1486917 RepID=A0A7R9WQ88_9STRA|mmetsp:Transcript_13179/g.36406  ORF Transcript_13179/g.36406 Transcript_13179/m.36406 type:complete len:133 (+) Transcript_13179:172-570(+)
MMMKLLKMALCAVLMASATQRCEAQDYDYQDGGYSNQDYAQDNLYHDYAMRQQDKEAAGPPAFGWGKILAGASLGWFLGGKFHSNRKEKKLNIKFKQEQKDLYTTYYNDVYALQQQNAELLQALEQMGVKVR